MTSTDDEDEKEGRTCYVRNPDMQVISRTNLDNIRVALVVGPADYHREVLHALERCGPDVVIIGGGLSGVGCLPVGDGIFGGGVGFGSIMQCDPDVFDALTQVKIDKRLNPKAQAEERRRVLLGKRKGRW